MSGLLIFAVFVAFKVLLDKIETVIQLWMNYRLSRAQIQLQEEQERHYHREALEDKDEKDETPRKEIGFDIYPDNLYEVEEQV